MRIGTFINTTKLADAELFYDSAGGAFTIEGPNIQQSINQAQVLALNDQGVIHWDNPEFLKSISGAQNLVAENPMGKVEIPDLNPGGIEPYSPDADRRKRTIALLLPIGILLMACAGVSMLARGLTFSNSAAAASAAQAAAQQTDAIKQQLTALQSSVRKQKKLSVYLAAVDENKISTSMSSSYAAAYAEKFPKTIPSILTAMPENYSSAYAAMLQSEIEKGSLRGTVLDGTITSVQYREAEKDFIAIFDLGGGRTAQLEVVDTDAGVRVLDILNAKDLNSALIGK